MIYCGTTYCNVGEKLFDTVEDVVADGLITLFMDKHNADKYLQSQRSSLFTAHNNLSSVRAHQPSNNGVSEALHSSLTPIAEQDFTFDDERAKEVLPIANGYRADPTATIIPRQLPSIDPVKSPTDDESIVSDSQVASGCHGYNHNIKCCSIEYSQFGYRYNVL